MGDNIFVFRLFQVSCPRNLGAFPSARVLTERWRLKRERCRRGMFESLVGSAGRSTGCSSPSSRPVRRLECSSPPSPDTVQRLGADPSVRWAPVRRWELIPPSPGGGDGAFSGASSSPWLSRSRVLLAAPQPEPQPTGAHGTFHPASKPKAVSLSNELT